MGNLVQNIPYRLDEDEFDHLISFVIHFVRDKKNGTDYNCYIDHSLGIERRIDTRIVTEMLPKKVLQYIEEIKVKPIPPVDCVGGKIFIGD